MMKSVVSRLKMIASRKTDQKMFDPQISESIAAQRKATCREGSINIDDVNNDINNDIKNCINNGIKNCINVDQIHAMLSRTDRE